jgi:hypothetical protein
LIFMAFSPRKLLLKRGFRGRVPALLSLTAVCFPPAGQTPVHAQSWNSPRALELIGSARALRHTTVQDPAFHSYSCQARGYVHFFLDREDTGERILVKTDQIALEVYWAAPDRFKQRIVGLRDEKSLPTNIRYHLDHLVVVQDDFGDRIRIGDGDEVEAVLHPVAPSSEAFYDFLLADSVTLTLPGDQESVRVYEIRVRPKNFDVPGFVGSVFLDRETAAIVRMSFTFTPASYVDSYLDHIQISLENGRWLGKYWLPYRQQLEIRREVPYLDIPAGSIIKGWFEIRHYEINPPLPVTLFSGPRISAVPEEQRKAFPFEEGLHEHLDTEGLSPPPEMKEIRRLALSIAKDHYLTGLGGFRLHLPQPMVSSGLRFNRAEGVFLGGGFSYGFNPSLTMAVYGGVSLGRERPEAEIALTGGERYRTTRLAGFLSQPRDLGPRPGTSGLLNSLAALSLDRDYQDLFFATGVGAFQSWTVGSGAEVGVEGRWEVHRPAHDEVSSDPMNPRFRPVIPTERGTWRSVALSVTAPTPWQSLTTGWQALAGRFEDRSSGELRGEVTFERSSLARHFDFVSTLGGGVLLGDPPLQNRYFLGGRETIPGYEFRSLSGDRFWLLRAEAARDLVAPWVRLRISAAIGGVRFGDEPAESNGGLKNGPATLTSGGLGLGFFWDILHLDLARGLSEGGGWELAMSVNHAFWPWL